MGVGDPVQNQQHLFLPQAPYYDRGALPGRVVFGLQVEEGEDALKELG